MLLETIGSELKQSVVNVRILTQKRKFLTDCVKKKNKASSFCILGEINREMQTLIYSSKARQHY